MHKRKIFLVGILTIAMLVTVGLTGCSAEELIALQGVIESADTLSGTVTVKMNDGSTLTFNFADVKAETVVAALGGLSIEPGNAVTIKQDKNGEVQEVVGTLAKVDGIISGLGADTVSINTEEGANITLEITPETVIHMENVDDDEDEDRDDDDGEDGGAVNFTDLQVGQQIEAKYDVTSLEVLEITIEDDEEEGEIEGTITAIDPDNYVVTISTEQGDIEVHVTSHTEIQIDDEGTGVFADLQQGQQVEVEYDVSSGDGLEIEVDDGGEEGDEHEREGYEEDEGEEGDED